MAMNPLRLEGEIALLPLAAANWDWPWQRKDSLAKVAAEVGAITHDVTQRDSAGELVERVIQKTGVAGSKLAKHGALYNTRTANCRRG